MIYTLGCSFTKWYWPTWSDWLAAYSDEQVTNWAYPGHTNQVIYYTLLERMSQLTANDTVYIMWTGNNRCCEWYDQTWINQHDCQGFFPKTDGKLWFSSDLPGQGFYKTHPDYQPSLTEMIVSNFTIIFNTQLLLDRIGCKYHMMFWQNPWLDTREQHRPVYARSWPTKDHISNSEKEFAQYILTIPPVLQLLKQINWAHFIAAPNDITNPLDYSGIWEFMLSSKELVAQNHVTDPHPNTLAHHDWVAQRILCQDPIHRAQALALSESARNMLVPEWSAEEAIIGANLILNQYPFGH